MGNFHLDGEGGVPKDDLKTLDCFIRAVELGNAEACVKIGIIYTKGSGVAVDKKRAALFERVGALRGSIVARYNIGLSEYFDLGNHEIAIRKIAAEAGYQPSLNWLKKVYNADLPGKEFISKEFLESTYRACHEAQIEVKTEEREKHRND
jgi:TPR repeat protein